MDIYPMNSGLRRNMGYVLTALREYEGRTFASSSLVSIVKYGIVTTCFVAAVFFPNVGSYVFANELPLVGSYNTPGTAWDIAASGDYAYIADDTRGLHIVDISNPASPVLVSTYKSWYSDIRGVGYRDGYAYSVDRKYGLEVIDVHNPALPTRVGGYSNAVNTGFFNALALAGQYAYLSEIDVGLSIVDISIPTSPVLVSTYTIPRGVSTVTIEGTRAYVGAKDGGLHILDISNPAQPVVLGTADIGVDSYTQPSGIAVFGQHVFMSERNTFENDPATGLYIFDVSDPSHPSLIEKYDEPWYGNRYYTAYDVVHKGTYAYVLDNDLENYGQNGYRMHVLSVHNPQQPISVREYHIPAAPTLAPPYGFAISGDYGYVAGGTSGMFIVDLASHDQPPTITLLGEATTTVEFGSLWSDLGATAADAVDGDITSSIQTTGTIDTHHLGTSTLTYTVINSAGLTASTTRTVVVQCTVHCYDNVMFLPGIEGSRLYDSGETVWLPADDTEAEHLRMNTNGTSVNQNITTKDALDTADFQQGYHNVYKKLLDDMEQWQADYGIIATTTPYDWRLSFDDVVTNGKKLTNGHISYLTPPDSGHDPYFIENLKQLAASSKTGKVTIVAHSMGGLVAKQMMLTLGDAQTAQYIDKIIFVATPQLGTPKAVGGLLHGFDTGIMWAISSEKMRDLGQNMPSAYALLPSNEYFSQIADPVVFLDNESLPEWTSIYGSTVSTIGTLRTFTTDSVNGREVPSYDDLASPYEVSDDLFEHAVTTHNALDYWTPPESVEVYSIAGWGNETISSIRYEKLPYMECIVAANTPGFIMSRDCSVTTRISFTPETVIDGDGTVVDPSAQWLYGDGGRKYWVNLDEYNGLIFDTPGLDQFRTGHANIFEVPQVRDFVEGVAKYGTDAQLPSSYVTVVRPTSITAADRLHFTLHSPLTLGFQDTHGNYTGAIDSGVTTTIPGVSYERFGEVQWLSVPKDLAGQVIMRGTGAGSFTLGIEEQQGNTITTHTTFAAIPTSPTTIATLTVDPTQSPTHTGILTVDFNGDTITDTILTAQESEIVLPPLDTTPPEVIIGFSTTTNHIVTTGTDDALPVTIATTSTIITDASGNTLTLNIARTLELPHLSTLVMPSFTYSSGTTTATTTSLRYFHLTNPNTGAYSLFISHIKTPTERFLAVYVKFLNKTYVLESKPQDDDADLSAQQALLLLRKKVKTYTGLYIPSISTEQGRVIIR